MVDARDCRFPDYREARRPSRVYRGEDNWVVLVSDSALAEPEGTDRVLLPDASRHVQDFCECFRWGDTGTGALQLAIALLLDVSGDVNTALRWHEHFAATYISKLPPTWMVPELDIALWLYCFQNARPGA